jgi:Holliday junction resolvase RusA-like endonuclease
MNFPPTTVSFFAPGIPKGQPRPRAFVRGKRAAVYDPGTAEGWKGQIALAWRELGIPAVIDGVLDVSLTFHLPRPKHHYTAKGVLKPSAPVWHTVKPDADNLAKAVLDALTALSVWKDDAQVSSLTIHKQYGSPTGCQISITTLPPHLS